MRYITAKNIILPFCLQTSRTKITPLTVIREKREQIIKNVNKSYTFILWLIVPHALKTELI